MRADRAAVAAAVLLTAGCADPPPAPATPSPAPRLIGAGGCSARGCHGRLEPDPAGRRWPTAFTEWVRWDRHGAAYHTLRGPLSQTIIAKLRAGGSAWNDAPDEPRCLACHVTPALANLSDSPGALRLRYDGVGCEACHTDPGRDTADWIGPHQTGWKGGRLAESYVQHGMRWLGDAKHRAEACVGCHVGAPATGGVPAREVTHDLIAAGHPRLFFDYLTFLDRLPPHWSEDKRNTKDGSPRPAETSLGAWSAGQMAAAKAGLDLYADRCKRAAGGAAVWPELADLSCFACHHELGQKPGDRANVWDGTLGPRLPEPLVRVLGWQDDPQYRKLAATGLVSRNRAGPLGDLAASLSGRLNSPLQPEFGALRAVPRALDWDTAAQMYYALRAADRDKKAAAGPLEALAKKLRLPRGPDLANSPINYDPAAVRDLLEMASEAITGR
ncbi:MAG: multiheme c-type cytochrome [Gemmataceae bacterium]